MTGFLFANNLPPDLSLVVGYSNRAWAGREEFKIISTNKS